MAEWLRHDVGLVAHPKWWAIRESRRHQAIALYLAELEFCTRYETDGWLPGSAVVECCQQVWIARPSAVVAALDEAGLVHRMGDPGEIEVLCRECAERLGPGKPSGKPYGKNAGFSESLPSWNGSLRPDRAPWVEDVFAVHGFLDRQPSHEEHEERRFQEKEKKRRQREQRRGRAPGGQMSLGGHVPYPDAVSPRGHENLSPPYRQTEEVPVLRTALHAHAHAREPHPDQADTAQPAEPEEQGADWLRTPDPQAPPDQEHVIAAIAGLRRHDRRTAQIVLPLAAQVSAAEFDDDLATARTSARTNDAGLLVELLRRRIADGAGRRQTPDGADGALERYRQQVERAARNGTGAP